jgi:urease beta subunit
MKFAVGDIISADNGPGQPRKEGVVLELCAADYVAVRFNNGQEEEVSQADLLLVSRPPKLDSNSKKRPDKHRGVGAAAGLEVQSSHAEGKIVPGVDVVVFQVDRWNKRPNPDASHHDPNHPSHWDPAKVIEVCDDGDIAVRYSDKREQDGELLEEEVEPNEVKLAQTVPALSSSPPKPTPPKAGDESLDRGAGEESLDLPSLFTYTIGMQVSVADPDDENGPRKMAVVTELMADGDIAVRYEDGEEEEVEPSELRPLQKPGALPPEERNETQMLTIGARVSVAPEDIGAPRRFAQIIDLMPDGDFAIRYEDDGEEEELDPEELELAPPVTSPLVPLREVAEEESAAITFTLGTRVSVSPEDIGGPRRLASIVQIMPDGDYAVRFEDGGEEEEVGPEELEIASQILQEPPPAGTISSYMS